MLKLLYTLIDKKVMTKEEMSVAFAPASSNRRFNAILQRADKEGKNVRTFFPVGPALQVSKDRFVKLKEVYNKNTSRINERK